jgi:lipopolysaccharide/colanic/teichoic acid biosynthesis glycosyltransferase
VFGKYNLTYLDPDVETEVDVLSGSFMFIRRAALQDVGYFDEDYFMYGEDIDLCHRIKQKGWKVLYTPSTQAIHYKGESTKKGELSYLTHFYSAMLIFTHKHFTGRYSMLLQILLTVGIYTRVAVAYVWRLCKYFASPALDCALIILAIFLAIKIWLPYHALERFQIVLPIYTIVWFASIYMFGAYHKKGRFHVKPVLWSSIVGLLINATFTYFFKQFAYSRVVVMISFILILILLSLWRILYRLIGPMSSKSPLSRIRRAVIIGAGREGKRILKQLQQRPDMHYEVCGFVDFEPTSVGKEIDGTEVLATIDNIRDVIRVDNINDVIFSSDRLSNAQILETIVRAQHSGVNFRIVPHELEYIVAKSSVDEIDTVPLLDFAGVAGPLDLAVKRIFDIIASSLVIVITAPVVLFNFIVGGTFWKRTIIGHGGSPTHIYVFKGGMGFIRSLPLWYSVFLGTLSIVGSEITEFENSKYHAIYKPGLSGLVQLKSREKKKALTQHEKDYYNLYYVKNQNIVTDLQILVKSLF